jgi:cytochrome c oxidase cbb3-type subunit 3
MPPWEAVFSAEERAELVVFIRSIQGTNPPNAKEPQGELVE